jgi:hypothetical protein
MGWFTRIFFSSSGGVDRKVHQKNSDNSVERGNRYTDAGGGKHTHESYSLDKTSGSYKEYSGGENSSDRSHNKR